jgi:3-oxoadipate enol-lactonase
MDMRADLAGVRNPTLVVVGDQDRATPPERARELVEGMPDAQLVLLRDCAHAPQLQHPKDFLAAIESFLAE